MAEFRVERGERREPLAVLPRYRKDEHGNPIPPTLILDLEFSKGVAGCAICNKPITKGTTRIKLEVKLDSPIEGKKGRARTHESFYLHPGCITDRIKPEVIRHGFDCYDCGAIPGDGLRWAYYGFTVSRFAPAPLCGGCIEKPKWARCQVCQIYYPPWMLQTVDDPSLAEEPEPAPPPATPTAGTGLSAVIYSPPPSPFDFRVPPVEYSCEFCAKRHGIRTVEAVESEAEKFERLRREIAEHGIFEAGEQF